MAVPVDGLARIPKKLEVLVINDEVETPSLLNPMSGQIFVTNKVGKRIMELADGSRDVGAIADEISREFKGARRAQVVEEALAFLSQSAENGLVSWLEGES